MKCWKLHRRTSALAVTMMILAAMLPIHGGCKLS